MRPLKFLAGLALLPCCAAVTMAVVSLVQGIRPESAAAIPRETWGLAIGFALWIVLFFTMPRPFRTYVLSHELTHALWAFLWGARVGRIRVSDRGGHVELSKTNAMITLAPYFFPLYTILVLLLYGGLSLFYDLHVYAPFWLGCVGLTWAFHLTFTLSMIGLHQTDLKEEGFLFSCALIFFMNVLGLGLWIVAVAQPTLVDFAGEFVRQLHGLWQQAAGLAARWNPPPPAP